LFVVRCSSSVVGPRLRALGETEFSKGIVSYETSELNIDEDDCCGEAVGNGAYQLRREENRMSQIAWFTALRIFGNSFFCRNLRPLRFLRGNNASIMQGPLRFKRRSCGRMGSWNF